MREAVFSTVQARLGSLEDESVLDAFAGSGALGLEALSRGARHVTFVENDRRALTALRANVATLAAPASATVLAGDAFRLAREPLPGEPFSLLLLDPPYRIHPGDVHQLLEDLTTHGGLCPGALIVYEHASGTDIVWPSRYTPLTAKRYGDTEVAYAVYEQEGE